MYQIRQMGPNQMCFNLNTSQSSATLNRRLPLNVFSLTMSLHMTHESSLGTVKLNNYSKNLNANMSAMVMVYVVSCLSR